MNNIHIMLDLETWGKRPGCDIRSIGAVVFDPVLNHVCQLPSAQFYIATDNPITRHGVLTDDGDYRKYPLARDPETVQWWNDQSPEAQAAFANPIDLRDACLQFGKWLTRLDAEMHAITDYPWFHTTIHQMPKSPNVKIWANGPQFDVSILAEVYHAVGLPVPWHYRAPRDFRTITDAAGMTREEFSNYGEAHNALHDAIAQAMTVCEAYKRLGLQTSEPRNLSKPLHEAGELPKSPTIETNDEW